MNRNLIDQITIKDNIIERVILHIPDEVQLIRIPAPKSINQGGILNIIDAYDWDLNDTVWLGSLQLIERQILSTNFEEFDTMDGLINLIDFSGLVFASVVYEVESVNLSITTSRRAFRILIDHEGKKIALGLVFKSSDVADQFSISLQSLRRSIESFTEARQDDINGLNSSLGKLTIQRSGDTDENAIVDEEENITHTKVNEIDNDQDENTIGDDDDDDFGDFVSG